MLNSSEKIKLGRVRVQLADLYATLTTDVQKSMLERSWWEVEGMVADSHKRSPISIEEFIEGRK